MQKPLMFGEHEVANIISSRMLELSAEQLQALEWSIEMTLESIYEYHQKHHREPEFQTSHPAAEVVKNMKVLAQLQHDISNF